MKFETGSLASTTTVAEDMAKIEGFGQFVQASLMRHMSGDWGEQHPEDEGLNDIALEEGTRLLSVYTFKETKEPKKIWIITEADRSATVVLYPSEY